MRRSPQPSSIRWVFLDRDGTLNVKPPPGEYVTSPADLRLLPGTANAIRMLNEAGLWLAVVTNQRCVSLGQISSAELAAIHAHLRHLLRLENAFLDAIYACTHQIGECACRKPEPGMLLGARREQPGLDFARAAIVGDSTSDIEVGRRLGLTTILIASAKDGAAVMSNADHVVASLEEAARIILRNAQAATARAR